MKKSTQDLFWIGGALLAAYLIVKNNSIFGMGEVASNLDVSRNEDLAGGCAHLIALEEHLQSSYSQTGNQDYLDKMADVRKMRRDAMSKLLPSDAPAENWCTTKHFLCGSMRMSETGSKYLADGNRDAAIQCFQIADDMKKQALNVASMKSDAPQCSVCKGG